MITIDQTTLIFAPIARCFDMARSVEVRLAGGMEWHEEAISGVTSGLLEFGDRVTWEGLHLGGLRTITTKVTALYPPFYFQETMVEGPFKSLQHDHIFREVESGATELRDILCFAAPLLLGGHMAETFVLRNHMEKVLEERNLTLRQLTESRDWHRYTMPQVRTVTE